ncbi:SRPBCC family protein [Chitinophagaceae bacterium 26-R-25]|nr:SRPBCC family protein [Chitinophagaceae bacterium 26-R-25]
MKILKLAIISAVVLFGLVFIISSFMPSTVKVSRATDIDAPFDSVRKYLSDIRNWEKWNLYVDTFTNKQYPSATSLTSDQVNISIVSTSDSTIKAEWHQKNTIFTSGYYLVAHDNMTTVQWYFDFKVKWYPWEKFASMVYDQQLGPIMEKSLARLKEQGLR